MTKHNSIIKIVHMILAAVLLTFSTSSAKETKTNTMIRSVDGYSVTIELSSGLISSIHIKHANKLYAIPKNLYTDIKQPHLGEGFSATNFHLEITKSKAFIGIKSGKKDLPADHRWVLSLPLKTVSRITRVANKTGYHEAHPSTALEMKPIKMPNKSQ